MDTFSTRSSLDGLNSFPSARRRHHYSLTNRGYPIIDLDHYFTDIHKYLRTSKKSSFLHSQTTAQSGRSDGRRVYGWMKASLCERCARWCQSITVDYHARRVNVNADLSHFDYIVPCGVSDKKVTSLHVELGREVDLQEVKDKIKFYFEKQFDCQFIPNTSLR